MYDYLNCEVVNSNKNYQIGDVYNFVTVDQKTLKQCLKYVDEQNKFLIFLILLIKDGKVANQVVYHGKN